MNRIIDMDADLPPLDPGTVFTPISDDITTEIAIPQGEFDLTISLVLSALEDELKARWYGERAVDDIVSAVRKRVGG